MFNMKKAKRWITKSQYAAPRDKEHVSVYEATCTKYTDEYPGLRYMYVPLVCFYEFVLFVMEEQLGKSKQDRGADLFIRLLC